MNAQTQAVGALGPLPFELISTVFTFLDKATLIKISSVSQAFFFLVRRQLFLTSGPPKFDGFIMDYGRGIRLPVEFAPSVVWIKLDPNGTAIRFRTISHSDYEIVGGTEEWCQRVVRQSSSDHPPKFASAATNGGPPYLREGDPGLLLSCDHARKTERKAAVWSQIPIASLEIDGKEAVASIPISEPRYLGISVKSDSKWEAHPDYPPVSIGEPLSISSGIRLREFISTLLSFQVGKDWWFICDQKRRILVFPADHLCAKRPIPFQADLYVWHPSDSLKESRLIQLYEEGVRNHSSKRPTASDPNLFSNILFLEMMEKTALEQPTPMNNFGRAGQMHDLYQPFVAPKIYCEAIGGICLGKDPYVILLGDIFSKKRMETVRTIGIFPVSSEIKQTWWEFEANILDKCNVPEIFPDIKVTVLPASVHQGWLVAVQESEGWRIRTWARTKLWYLKDDGTSQLLVADKHDSSINMRHLGVDASAKGIFAYYQHGVPDSKMNCVIKSMMAVTWAGIQNRKGDYSCKLSQDCGCIESSKTG